MHSTVRDILKSAEQPFNIIEEFAALSPKRKILLCDHLFIEGRDVYQKTVALLWPEARLHDMKKLEKFLELLTRTSN